MAADALARAYEAGPTGFGVARALEPLVGIWSYVRVIEANSMFSALGVPGGVREPRAQRAHVCGNQPMATATGALVSSNSAGSNRASRRLYSLANAGQIVKFRPSGPTYHE